MGAAGEGEGTPAESLLKVKRKCKSWYVHGDQEPPVCSLAQPSWAQAGEQG